MRQSLIWISLGDLGGFGKLLWGEAKYLENQRLILELRTRLTLGRMCREVQNNELCAAITAKHTTWYLKEVYGTLPWRTQTHFYLKDNDGDLVWWLRRFIFSQPRHRCTCCGRYHGVHDSFQEVESTLVLRNFTNKKKGFLISKSFITKGFKKCILIDGLHCPSAVNLGTGRATR